MVGILTAILSKMRIAVRYDGREAVNDNIENIIC